MRRKPWVWMKKTGALSDNPGWMKKMIATILTQRGPGTKGWDRVLGSPPVQLQMSVL